MFDVQSGQADGKDEMTRTMIELLNTEGDLLYLDATAFDQLAFELVKSDGGSVRVIFIRDGVVIGTHQQVHLSIRRARTWIEENFDVRLV